MVPTVTSRRYRWTARDSLRNTDLETVPSFMKAKVIFLGVAVMMRERVLEERLWGINQLFCLTLEPRCWSERSN